MWISAAKRQGREPRLRYQESLGPITVHMPAPPDVVFDIIAGPYLHKTPRALTDKLRVLERGSDLVVADHYTPILFGRFVVTTRETVRFERPHRISFRLLHGPVAHVEEDYLLDSAPDGTTFTYRGTLASNLPIAGRGWARANAGTWTAVVRGSLDQVKAEATRRGA